MLGKDEAWERAASSKGYTDFPVCVRVAWPSG